MGDGGVDGGMGAWTGKFGWKFDAESTTRMSVGGGEGVFGMKCDYGTS